VFQTIDEIARGDIRTKIRDMLGAFLFRGEDIDKKVKVLSGGERSRLALVKLLLEPYNLLVLDEPTNHLDMRSKDILKQALSRYDGTLIVVSHDRDFLDGLVKKVFEFRHNRVKEHLGGIYDFLRKKKLENLRDLELKEKNVRGSVSDELSFNKQKYFEKKEYERNLRKIQRKLSDTEKEIDDLETEIAALDKILAGQHDSAVIVAETFEKYSHLQETLNRKMDLWGEYTVEIEEFLRNNK